MNINLSEKTLKYIREYLYVERKSLFDRLSFNDVKSGKEIVITDDDSANEIRDWALDKIEIEGYNEKYDLTNEGIALQEIIDKFYTG